MCFLLSISSSHQHRVSESISPSCWEAPGSLALTLKHQGCAVCTSPLPTDILPSPGSLLEYPSPEDFPHPYPEDHCLSSLSRGPQPRH